MSDHSKETGFPSQSRKPGFLDAALLAALAADAARTGDLETLNRALAEGVPLKINPDAHFGREKYQKFLTEYVLIQRKNNKNKLPLSEVTSPNDLKNISGINIDNTFGHYLDQQLHPNNNQDEKNKFRSELTKEESANAIKGVLGMLRFGTHTTPILLEALGSLLSPPYQIDSTDDAKLLACRAYLKASYESPEGQVRLNYQKMAIRSLVGLWRNEDIESVKLVFNKELEEANDWYSKLRENELSWIKEGKNPELEFDKLYDADPELSGGMSFYEKIPTSIILSSCLIIMIICPILWYRIRQRRIAKLKLENK